ncbi:MAG: hypothetical protein ABIK22_03750 [candidate division WOR-3 bacterium]
MKSIALLLLIFTALTAQSFFNPNGLGEVTLPADARFIALGNPSALTPWNPGNYFDLTQTRIKLTLTGTGLTARQHYYQRALGTVRPTGIYAAVPLPTHTRLLLSVDSRFNQDFDVWSESLADTVLRFHIVSRGGIHSFNFGVSQPLFNRLCLGAQFQQLIGGSRENWHYWAEGLVATDTIEIDYSARTFRLGAAGRLARLTLTGFYDLPFQLTATRFKHLHGVASDSLRNYRIHLPATLSFGFTAGPFYKTQISTGFELRNWANTTIDNLPAGYQNVWRASIGIEYEQFPGYPFRLGYSTGRWYCSTVAGGRISESAVHLGTGVLLPKFGTLDIAGEVIFRKGETPAGFISETAGRLHLTIAYEESWKKRTRRWGY